MQGSRRNLAVGGSLLVLTVMAGAAAVQLRGAGAAAALDRAGDPCPTASAEIVVLDERGRSLQCKVTDGSGAWTVVDNGTPSIDLATPATTTTTAPATTVTTRTVGRGVADASVCPPYQEGLRTLAADGTLLECTKSDTGFAWVAQKPGRAASSTVGALGNAVATTAGPDPLAADLGNPTGLPLTVTMPPGAVLVAGSPHRLPSEDWWKNARWRNDAVIAGSTDVAAVHTWFVQQCASIGWLHDPERDETLPTDPKPAAGFRPGAVMQLGECRTAAGSDGDPSRRRPWYLAWSATVQPGGSDVEVVVELRDRTRVGGFPL